LTEKNGHEPESVGGTLIRGEDGSLYLLRDDVLEMCRVNEEDAIPFLNELLDSHHSNEESRPEGFTLSTGNVVQAMSFVGPFGGEYDRRRLVEYTTMCTGTMGLIDFVPVTARNVEDEEA
jgi:hypothetical protein